MLKLEQKQAWVEAIQKAFHEGKPEPAWDQVPELLDLLSDALEICSRYPEAAALLEKRIEDREP